MPNIFSYGNYSDIPQFLEEMNGMGWDPTAGGNLLGGASGSGNSNPWYTGGPNMGGFGGFDFGGLFDPSGGGGGGGSSYPLGNASQLGGSALGSLLAGLFSGGGGGGSNVNINNSGTNGYDALLQNPYLMSILQGAGNGTVSPSPNQNTSSDLVTNIAKFFGGLFPNLGGNGSTPGFGGASTNTGSTVNGGMNPIPGVGNAPGTTQTPQNLQQLVNTLGPVLSGILGLGNAGLNAFGAVNAVGQQDWLNQQKTNTSGLLQNLLNGNQANANYAAGTVLPEMTGLMNALGPAYSNGLTQANNGLQGGFGGLQSFKAPTQTSQVPGLQGVFDQLGGLQGYGNTLLGQLAPMATGSTPGQSTGLAQALQLATGSNSGQGALSNTAMSLLNSGQSPLSAASQSAAINALLNGGMTQGLQGLTGPASGLANGQNPIAQALASRGLNLTSQNPLLSLPQVQSIAENQSATQSNNQLNSLRQQLLDRTGVTGPAIASGSQNDLLNQLGDQAMQNQSQAGQQALLNQQGLQLGLFGQGTQLANSGQTGMLQGQSLGMNTLLQQASQALQNQTGLGGLGNQGLNTYLAQLGLGGNLVGQGTQTQLGGLGALNSLLGTQNQSTNSLANLLGTTGGLTGQASSDVFNLQNLGLNQNSQMYSALNSLLGNQNSMNSNLLGGLTSTAQYPFNWATTLQGQVPGFAGSMASLFGGTTQPSNYFASPSGSGVFNGTILGTGGLTTPTPTGTGGH